MKSRAKKMPVVCRTCKHKAKVRSGEYHSGRVRCLRCGGLMDRQHPYTPGLKQPK